MTVKKLCETAVMENAHNVDARNLYNKPEAVITVITLDPGQSLRRHITPVDVAFYVIEGSGTVEIGGSRQEIGADTLVESPKNIVHCWHNSNDVPLKLMVLKAPKPAGKTIFVSC